MTPAISVRGLSNATHRALKARAAENGRSAEAEVRAILDDVLFPPDRLLLGTYLHELFRDVAVDLDIERDKTPIEPPDFS